MFIVDSHCHLNFKQLEPNLDDLIKRSDKANVKLMQTICTKISEFEDIKAIVHKHKNIFCSVGVHPNEVKDKELIDVKKITSLSKDPKVIGIGETGLDYYYKHSNRDLQQISFERHIDVSRETLLPIIIHNRASDEDMINILKKEMNLGVFKGVLHCFSSSKQLAEVALELGMYISISGIVTFKNANNLRAIVRTLPLDRLLVETDSPYLAPEPIRGKTNEPSYISYIVEYLSQLFGEKPERIAEITTKNFLKLFDKVKL